MTDFSLIFNKGYVEFEDGNRETIFFYGIDPAGRIIVRTRHNQYRADDNDKVWKFSWFNPFRNKYEYKFDIKRIFIKEDILK